jgi:hypothetical protein
LTRPVTMDNVYLSSVYFTSPDDHDYREEETDDEEWLHRQQQQLLHQDEVPSSGLQLREFSSFYTDVDSLLDLLGNPPVAEQEQQYHLPDISFPAMEAEDDQQQEQMLVVPASTEPPLTLLQLEPNTFVFTYATDSSNSSIIKADVTQPAEAVRQEPEVMVEVDVDVVHLADIQNTLSEEGEEEEEEEEHQEDELTTLLKTQATMEKHFKEEQKRLSARFEKDKLNLKKREQFQQSKHAKKMAYALGRKLAKV